MACGPLFCDHVLNKCVRGTPDDKVHRQLPVSVEQAVHLGLHVVEVVDGVAARKLEVLKADEVRPGTEGWERHRVALPRLHLCCCLHC